MSDQRLTGLFTNRYRIGGLMVLLVSAFVSFSHASAQDFRVATTVSVRSAAHKRPQAVGRSLTLFHAGKVYDYMEDLKEVVILDPLQSRFVILNFNGTNLATRLRFEELHQFLKVARSETRAKVESLEPARRQALLFQLAPEFTDVFDPSTDRLTLSSPLIEYVIETEQPNKPLVVQQYLQYADWAARMNYVLHPGALYPDVRIAVNKALADHERMPTEVRLTLRGDQPLQIEAHHKFEWTLYSVDRSLIAKCDKSLSADETRWVDFRDYQRQLVAATRGR